MPASHRPERSDQIYNGLFGIRLQTDRLAPGESYQLEQVKFQRYPEISNSSRRYFFRLVYSSTHGAPRRFNIYRRIKIAAHS
jgi:hypothetical protein